MGLKPTNWFITVVAFGLVPATVRAEAEYLYGTAALLSAGSAASVANSQANADVATAQINANAQMEMTSTVAAADQNIAAMSAQTSMYQAYMGYVTDLINQSGTTQRLGMQLSELDRIQQRIADMQTMQFNAELSLQKVRLDLAQQQLQANISAAKANYDLQLAEAGLTMGNAPGDSGSSLSVTRYNLLGGNYSGVTPSDKLVSSVSGSALGVASSPRPAAPETNLDAGSAQQARALASGSARAFAESGSTSTQSSPSEDEPSRPIRRVSPYSDAPVSSQGTASGSTSVKSVPYQLAPTL